MYPQLFALALSLFAWAANAAPPTPEQSRRIEHMVRECQAPMAQEVCRVQVDVDKCKGAPNQEACFKVQFSERFPRGVIVAGPNGGRFSGDELWVYARRGKDMCSEIPVQCNADFSGRGCATAKASWQQD